MKNLTWVLASCLLFASMNVSAQPTLRQSDAVEIVTDPLVDSTDGVTPETALSIVQADVHLVKCAAAGDCEASAQKSDATSCAHVADGRYECDLNTTDTDTVGILHITIEKTGAAPWFATYAVVDTSLYDAALADGATSLIDTDMTAHQTQGTLGQAIGDPGVDTDSIWSLSNTNLNATVSSRMATFTLPTNFSTLSIDGSGFVTPVAASIRTAVGLASANMDTQFTGIETGVDVDTIENTDATNYFDAQIATYLSQQRILTGTCDSGSTTTCVDDALTQASASQLQDRAICFSDSWCALITTFTPASDQVTTTKVAPATRASLAYTIFPATAQ